MPNSPPTLCARCRQPKGKGCTCGARKHLRKTSERGYGRDWQKFRSAYLSDHPLCMDCQAEDMVTPATEVHHRQKIKHSPHLRLEPTNCMALCDKHHNQRSRRGE